MSLRPPVSLSSALVAPPEPRPRRPLDAEKLERLLNEDEDELPSPDDLDEDELEELVDDEDEVEEE